MSKVFITQMPTVFHHSSQTHIPKIDISPAAAYGEIITIFPPNSDRLTGSEMSTMAENALTNFNPLKDYILPMGSPILNTIVGNTTSFFFRGECYKMLAWQSKSSTYRIIDLVA